MSTIDTDSLQQEPTTIDIRNEHGHYTAYVDGRFFCSADTYLEITRELEAAGYN